ncbi:MAG TPA: (d)CMP kinase [Candidatus Saccharimonadales bacterium]|nr:(d)CMP kinase [Candidatus Saccharimonadales bacterium]
MPKGFIIAIDGPAASGKGTIAQKLAAELNGFYLYTGAMYRSIALLVINKGLNPESEQEVESVLSDLNLEFSDSKIFLNGEDVTERIKESDTASGASEVGVWPKVRESVDQKLREIAGKAESDGKIVVSEGRDTATTIFPEALVKIYLTALPEVRAKRRLYQYSSLHAEDLKKTLKNLKERDERDSGRKASPLPVDPESLGYFVLDNSKLTEDETLNVIYQELRKRKLIND